MSQRRSPPTLFPEIKAGPENPFRDYELHYRELGFLIIAGVDEAGRGPLAGPVVAAAVVIPPNLDPHSPIRQVRDSKALDPRKRERLYHIVVEHAADVAWALCDPREIDRLNILAASLEAMRRAVLALEPAPDLCLIDGSHALPGSPPSKAVVKGDRYCLSIAAASIVAKVVRDQIMDDLHRLHPQYGFNLHKGYPTALHKAAIARHGPCPVHRTTFRGVREFCPDQSGR
jgi:ribonuclease HII